MNAADRISRSLSYWLRHRPDAGGLTLDKAGWANVEKVLEALARAGFAADLSALRQLVAESDKNRFELSADGTCICARQGHSIAIEGDWPVAEPPEFLFHGTVERFRDGIAATGLRPMKRHHVHLSHDVDTARAVGARRGNPVILKVAASRMAATGHVFRLSANGVWLTDCVPPEYLEWIN